VLYFINLLYNDVVTVVHICAYFGSEILQITAFWWPTLVNFVLCAY